MPKPPFYNRAFGLTRWRLTILYAGTMSVILTASAIGSYLAMARDHRQELDHRLESVAGTLHDSLEPALRQPGQLTPTVSQVLPTLCPTGLTCAPLSPERHVLSVMNQEGYYLRFLDLSGRAIATSGQPPALSPAALRPGLQTLRQGNGDRYRQLSLLLKNNQGQSWGYLQLGRTLQPMEHHLTGFRLLLLGGLPLVLALVWGISWWLAAAAMAPAYGAYQQVQQFTADAAHELRTPLAALRATVESGLSTPQLAEAETRDILQVMHRQSQRLGTLVNDLLLLSRLDQQIAPAYFSPCSLSDLISDIVEELAALALAKQIKLRTDAWPQPPIFVRGNAEQLYRLVLNIVINAIEHTPDQGTVTLSLTSHYHQAQIVVQDTGPGIAPAEQPKVFRRFYRVNADRSRHTGGAGLGLAIALAIAQAHGGTIQVSSQPGQGSRFMIYLPQIAQG